MKKKPLKEVKKIKKIKKIKKVTPNLVGTDRPRCGGKHHWQPGVWVELWERRGRRMAERGFIASAHWRTVEVDQTVASGRYCQELRQGGSLMVPGFKPWGGRWVKVDPET
jgi:hypothetical protein